MAVSSRVAIGLSTLRLGMLRNRKCQSTAPHLPDAHGSDSAHSTKERDSQTTGAASSHQTGMAAAAMDAAGLVVALL